MSQIRLYTVESTYREDGTVFNTFTVNELIEPDEEFRAQMEDYANKMADLVAVKLNEVIAQSAKNEVAEAIGDAIEAISEVK